MTQQSPGCMPDHVDMRNAWLAEPITHGAASGGAAHKSIAAIVAALDRLRIGAPVLRNTPHAAEIAHRVSSVIPVLVEKSNAARDGRRPCYKGRSEEAHCRDACLSLFGCP